MSFDEFERDDAPFTPQEPEHGQDPAPEPEYAPEDSAAPEPEYAPQEAAGQNPAPEYAQVPSYDAGNMWSEPVYESAGDSAGAYTPGRYAYGAQNIQPPQPDKPRKPKKKHGFLKAVCLVLVCALVAGTCSYLVVDYMFDHQAVQRGGKQVVLGSSLNSEKDGQNRPTGGTDGTMTATDIYYDLALNQVVGVNTSLTTTNIFGQSSDTAVSGSGIILSEDGYILTNYHVISYAVIYGGSLTVLTYDGTEYPATIEGYVEGNDVAVIKIDAHGLSPAALGDSDAMAVGESVYAVGNPLGELEYTITPGIVSALDRVVTTTDEITRETTSINMFQISAAVNSGNSGGPVYNSRGEVIGIVTAKYSDSGVEGLGFAIPINDAVAIATQLIENGYVANAGLGIRGLDVTQFYQEYAMEYYKIPYGVYVDQVNAGSAAEKAGLQAGDIITALGEKEVASMDELKLALRHYSPGDTETVTVYRLSQRLSQGESLELTITFEELVEDTNEDASQQRPVEGWGYNGGR